MSERPWFDIPGTVLTTFVQQTCYRTQFVIRYFPIQTWKPGTHYYTDKV